MPPPREQSQQLLAAGRRPAISLDRAREDDGPVGPLPPRRSKMVRRWQDQAPPSSNWSIVRRLRRASAYRSVAVLLPKRNRPGPTRLRSARYTEAQFRRAARRCLALDSLGAVSVLRRTPMP